MDNIQPFSVNKPIEDEVFTEVEAPISLVFDGEPLTIEPFRVAFKPAGEYLTANDAVKAVDRQIAEVNGAKSAIEIEIAELQRKYTREMEALQNQLAPYAAQIFDLRRAKRQAEQELYSAEMRLREALLSERVLQEFRQNSVKFEEATQDKFWREFAFPYQVDGGKMLASAKRAILGDEMGLGKTLESQIACDMLGAKKILVVVPDDLVSNFVREIHHWAPHRQVFMLGKMPKAQRDVLLHTFRDVPEIVIVTNYSAWRKDKSLIPALIKMQFDTCILDEAHTIKNVSTSAFKGVKELVLAENSCPECGGYLQPIYNREGGKWISLGDGREFSTPRNYMACCGVNEPSSGTISVDAFNVATGCGWSAMKDKYEGAKREYGSMRSIKNLIPMTGSVILNSPKDIFALLHLIDDQNFDSETAFLRTYCQQDYYQPNKWVFKPGGLESLTVQLAGKYIKRKRTDVGITLPKQEIRIHTIEMDKELYPAQAKVIEDLTKHAMILLSSGDRMAIMAEIALITRKRQANVWPAGIEIKDTRQDSLTFGMVLFSVGEDVQESIKIDKCIMPPNRSESGEYEGLIPEYTAMGDMTNGDRVVVFSQFKGPLKELESRIREAGISVVRLDGDTPEALRDEIRMDFDRRCCDAEGYEKKWQVVLANYKSGGTGLNLNGATHTIIMDEEWNAGKRDQAYARTDRMGQTEDNSVDVLRLSGTIDTWLAALIDGKEEMMNGFESQAQLANALLDAMRNGEVA